MKAMIPESRLIRSELILREMSLPDEVKMARKSLVRWVALSLGLILPNESRRLLLDILDVLLWFHVKGEYPTTQDLLARLAETTKERPNPKAVYYHLLRLREAGFLSRRKGHYYLGEGDGKRLSELFRTLYTRKADSAFSSIGEALERLEDSYRQ